MGRRHLRRRTRPTTARRSVEDGELHVELSGREAARPVRAGPHRSGIDKEQWLLLHKHDEFAVKGWDAEDHPRSVLTGRTNDEVAADPDRLWRSDLPAAQASVALKFAAPDGRTNSPRSTASGRPAHGTSTAESCGSRTWTRCCSRRAGARSRSRSGISSGTRRRSAPTLVPYLAGRALNMHRYPQRRRREGLLAQGVARLTRRTGWPRWDNAGADEGETRTYLVVQEPAALVWAANFGALEWHAVDLADRPSARSPTYALIDLDPGERTTSWTDLLALARLHRTALDHLGVTARPKVTGRRGIQIWVPIRRGPSFDETRAWVEQLSRSVGAVVPELVSWKWQVRDRSGLARLDYTQNAINKTLVAPYSPAPRRARRCRRRSTGTELDDPKLRPDRFTIRTIGARIAERGDLFRPVLDDAAGASRTHRSACVGRRVITGCGPRPAVRRRWRGVDRQAGPDRSPRRRRSGGCCAAPSSASGRPA